MREPAFWFASLLLLGGARLPGADRCADARDDIRRAEAEAQSGREEHARSLLRSALLACPMNAQNLDLLAEAYDALGDFTQAGNFRSQAMRVRGITSKPAVEFRAASPSIERGQTTDLNWSTSYATEININPDLGRVPGKGTRTVAPPSSTTYQLVAKGPGGATTAEVPITVTIPRLTEANILDLLRNEVPKPRIAQLMTERGIAFELTASVEQRLRSAGADDMLIEAVKKAHH